LNLLQVIAGSGINPTVGSNISFVLTIAEKKRKRQKASTRKRRRKRRQRDTTGTGNPAPERRTRRTNTTNRETSTTSTTSLKTASNTAEHLANAKRASKHLRTERNDPRGTEEGPPNDKRAQHDKTPPKANSHDNGRTAAARQRLKFAAGQGTAPPRVLPRPWQTRFFLFKE